MFVCLFVLKALRGKYSRFLIKENCLPKWDVQIAEPEFEERDYFTVDVTIFVFTFIVMLISIVNVSGANVNPHEAFRAEEITLQDPA